MYNPNALSTSTHAQVCARALVVSLHYHGFVGSKTSSLQAASVQQDDKGEVRRISMSLRRKALDGSACLRVVCVTYGATLDREVGVKRSPSSRIAGRQMG